VKGEELTNTRRATRKDIKLEVR